ncbi:MAG: lipopolysaccharide heptosyltransferase II [Candidatus Cloacimonadota bacterium]|nr:lipopolysaccharide heptosyltransferase II [Candidatus Cloacimonadota bacterium]
MKILIIRFSSLGDIILTTPILKMLRRQYPTDTIHFLTKQQFVPILENNPNINLTIPYNKDEETIFVLAKKVREANYDLIIDLQAKLNTFFIKLFNRKSTKLTYKKEHLHRWFLTKKLFASHFEPVDSTVNLYASVLKKLNIELESIQTEIFLTPLNSKITVREESKDTKKIVIAPGAKHFTKQYPPEYYSELITMLKNEFKLDVILIGNKNEITLSQRISNECEHQLIDLTGKTDLQELFDIINQADLFISGDTGPMHIAAALQKPQIAIFGSTHPNLGFSPINENAIIMQRDLECRPCSLHGSAKCPKKHFKCMKDLKPDEIFAQIQTIL